MIRASNATRRQRRTRERFIPRHLRGTYEERRTHRLSRFSRLPRWARTVLRSVLSQTVRAPKNRIRPLAPPSHASAAPAATPRPTTPLPNVVPRTGDGPGAAASRRDWRDWLRENAGVLILNFGSMCTLTAFCRSDILELRTLSATGSSCTVIYFLTKKPGPLQVVPMAWSGVFASVNLFFISKIMLERKGQVVMSEEEEDLYKEHFLSHGVTPRQFKKVLKVAKKRYYQKGEIICRANEKMRHVRLILSGRTRGYHKLNRNLTAASSVPGNRNSLRGGDSGAWIGEVYFLEDLGRKMARRNEGYERPAMINHVAEEPVVLLEWSNDELADLLKSSGDMRAAMTQAMTAAVVGKIVNLYVDRKETVARGGNLESTVPPWFGWLTSWAGASKAQPTQTLVQFQSEKIRDTPHQDSTNV